MTLPQINSAPTRFWPRLTTLHRQRRHRLKQNSTSQFSKCHSYKFCLSTRHFPNSWKCKDRRYLIREIGSGNSARETLEARCLWDETYSPSIDQLECVLSFCDNITDVPNKDGSNYNFVWDRKVVPLNNVVQYPCKSGMKVENATNTKVEADSFIRIKCGEDGLFRYPSPWPKCYDSVTCEDPGTPTNFNSTSYTTTTTTTTQKPWIVYDVRRSTYVKKSEVGDKLGKGIPLSNPLECCDACRAVHGDQINLIRHGTSPGKCDCYSYNGNLKDKFHSTSNERTTTRCGDPRDAGFPYSGRRKRAVEFPFKTSGTSLSYKSMISYRCADPRQYIYQANEQEAQYRYSECQWNKKFTLNVAELECRIHHCSHPHLHQGSHEPPPAENNLNLVTPHSYWTLAHWHIGFGSHVTYTCPANQFFEEPDPVVVSPVQRSIDIECLTNGTYAIPPNSQYPKWPNCTATVRCGQPPPKPANGAINGTFGFDGSIEWLYGAPDLQETYNTWVEYRCADGSQFDTDNDNVGDTVSLRSRCQWDKTWSLPSLPPCYVTQCVLPFPLPPDTYLEELTDAWTNVNSNKEYRCQNETGGVATMFWESDRTKSTFSMSCKPDGTYDFNGARENWPTCLTGIHKLFCMED